MPTVAKKRTRAEKPVSEATLTLTEPTRKKPRISTESSSSDAQPTTARKSASSKPKNIPATSKTTKVAPSKKSTQESIENAIGYAEHKESLKSGLKDLKEHVRRDRTDGYEEQAEMMTDISAEILKWLPKLWQLMTKVKGPDFKRIQQALVLCTDTVKGMEKCNSRCEYTDLPFNIKITDDDKNVIYKSSECVLDMLAWMWKELLVHAASKNQSIDAMLTLVERRDLAHSVFSLIRKPGSKQKGNEEEFWDAHWSDAMKESASQMCAKRQQK
ncbi:hypothetical protein JR316_0006914 [Psilocybe cubensis]|uniref:Uncharacterized protein n=2 Tax=Psilocybe cubensis TaxID=181762 RepID=A0ACB8GXK9_PSICU|nr:hypothetical protein JR316_0006914 [Psilocybe cubensis]KAH9480316.1 hypothetical protein JR316_0006914 [Psilocybe cubensis]